MTQSIELTAVYRNERIRFENADGDTVIIDADHVDGELPEGCPKHFALKGPDCDFIFGHTYRYFGRWTRYRNKRTGEQEHQFAFISAVECQPATRAGVIKYLEAAGKGNGVGRATATKLWEQYGPEAVKVLRESPERAASEIKGLSLDHAKLTAAALAEKQHIEHASIALMELLDRRGFPKATPKRCLDQWGNAATEIVQRNPYALRRFRGCGFKLTDAMYLDLGHPPGRIKRQALCAWHRLASDQIGHTWFPVEFAIQGIRENVSGTELRPAEALLLAKRARVIETARTVDEDGSRKFVDAGGRLWVAEGSAARHERFVARHVADALEEPPQWPPVESVKKQQQTITDHQLDALTAATSGMIGILGGSPGTGKSFTAAGVIAAIVEAVGIEGVAVAAPTGKAAVRVTEALTAYSLPIRARTIHSLLGIDKAGADGGGWTFKHNENDPLNVEFLIVDESSMIDTSLMASLLAARAKGTHVLFVGDVNQLPPVGRGAPLRDLIGAGIPYGELTEIQRNSGRIVQACADIRDGNKFSTSAAVDLDAGENLYCLGGDSSEEMLVTLDGIFEYVSALGFDPIWETQVVVPVNKKSDLSRVELNKVLQHRLNHNPGERGQVFRVGDKAVNTKNGFFTAVDMDESDDDCQTNDRGEVYVANGELGEVIQAEQKFIVVKLDKPARVVRIPFGEARENGDGESSTGSSWDLGFAISVHKSQGAEWSVVIVVLDEYPGARMVCDRSWIYTAISRAKKLCLLLGRVETAHRFCRTTKVHERQTFLKELILQEQSKRLLALI